MCDVEGYVYVAINVCIQLCAKLLDYIFIVRTS